MISSRPPAPNLDFQGSMPVESGSLWEGEQLGQFLLQKFIGGGGMGIVFRALDTTLNREVALKVLSRDQSTDEEMLRRFRNEAQSAARLNHDNIAQVFFVGEDRGVHYIVFEYIEGVNIRDLVEQRGPMPLEEAISYTYQIAQALEHASERAVIHRDIKPSNVLISADGKAKLVDMGLARLNQLAAAGDELTASGVTLGTFDYISPEQARDPRSADVRSDLYSLGCSFFFMLTARPPFPEGTVLQKLLQHQGDSPPDPRTFRPELPVEVTRILARLLAKNPAQRYQQPAELIDELTALGELLGIQLGGSRAAWTTVRRSYWFSRWQHHLPWIVPIAALFLIVLALDFYWSLEPADTPGTVLAPGNHPALPKSVPLVPSPVDAPPPPETAPAAPGPLGAGTDGATAGTKPDGKTPAPWGDSGIDPQFAWISELMKQLAAARDKSQSPAPPIPPPDDVSQGDRSTDDAAGGRASATPPANRENVLSVGDEANPGNYTSLHAACSEAKSGDVIELRYNGRRTERPIAISNVNLTIRAGREYQPIVVFQPPPESIGLKDPPVMVSVAGGQLTASNVHWEFELPRNVPGDLALFETRRCDLLEFHNCTLTVRGQTAYNRRVAFFDVKAPPGTGSMNMDASASDAHVVRIHLRNCVARGEATFLRDNDLLSVRLNWDNGLLATSERLFVAEGNALQPHNEKRAELTLNHVTAMVAGGLVLLTNSEEAPYQLMTEVTCDDCILAAAGKPPLVEQRGSDGIDEYQTRFEWRGQHDYFDGFDVFWLIMNSAGQTGSKQLDFNEWKQLWQDQSQIQTAGRNAVVWRQLPGENRPYHAHAPADYALDARATSNAAAGGARDNSDAGCQIDYLPAPPSESRPNGPTGRDP
ncbi:MAG: serine/threonine-protein kinase [Pirellulales bacterium]